MDYSENERMLYLNSIRVLQKLECAFKKEGNEDLFQNKLREDRMGMDLYDRGLACRYLYIVDGAH